VSGHGAEAQSAGVHPLDVDRRQRSLQLAGDLGRDRDAAAGDADDDRVVELERGHCSGQGAPRRLTISEQWRDPRDDAHHPVIVLDEFSAGRPS
jgi:hypothetical protein